jgi:hypothetical protein
MGCDRNRKTCPVTHVMAPRPDYAKPRSKLWDLECYNIQILTKTKKPFTLVTAPRPERPNENWVGRSSKVIRSICATCSHLLYTTYYKHISRCSIQAIGIMMPQKRWNRNIPREIQRFYSNRSNF